jgi:hypothetical protein
MSTAEGHVNEGEIHRVNLNQARNPTAPSQPAPWPLNPLSIITSNPSI